MRKLIPFLIAAAGCVYAGDAGFNGRWDLTSVSEQRTRAWWLEISGADTDKPQGKFVTAFAGDMNVIQEISVSGNELTFGWVRTERPRNSETPVTRHLVYKAKLVGDKLEGTFQVEGSERPPLKWVGVRAPVIPDKDDGTWREGEPVMLFTGKDLSGWKSVEPNREIGWTAKDGVLASTGRTVNIISEKKFWNFKLHIEYRIMEHSNSGIGLRGRYEVQVIDDAGREPNTHSNGSLYSRIAPAVNASRPAGEWQSYDMRLVGRQVTVVLNGKTLIDKGEVEGLTAIAVDSNEAEAGPIYLQGDHGPVEFRNIVVTPLLK